MIERLTTSLLATALVVSGGTSQEAEPAPPDAEARLAAAVAQAKLDNKRVLLAFYGQGADSETLRTQLKRDRDLSRLLLYEFVVVDADVAADGALAKRLEIDVAAPPVLAVLDADAGRLAVIERDAMWSKDDGGDERLDRAALATALRSHQTTPLNAEKLLADALAQAVATERNVFVHFDAPW